MRERSRDGASVRLPTEPTSTYFNVPSSTTVYVLFYKCKRLPFGALRINRKFICLNCLVNLGVPRVFLLSDLLEFVLSL